MFLNTASTKHREWDGGGSELVGSAAGAAAHTKSPATTNRTPFPASAIFLKLPAIASHIGFIEEAT